MWHRESDVRGSAGENTHEQLSSWWKGRDRHPGGSGTYAQTLSLKENFLERNGVQGGGRRVDAEQQGQAQEMIKHDGSGGKVAQCGWSSLERGRKSS